MSPIVVTENTFSQQVELLRQIVPFRDKKHSTLCDILARLYGYSSEQDYRNHILKENGPEISKQSLQRQFPELVNRLSTIACIEGHIAKHVMKKLWPHHLHGKIENWRQHSSTFTFHGYLTDILNKPRCNQTVEYRYDGFPSIKDAVEAQGVPHTEVVLITQDGSPISWDNKLEDNIQYDIYPSDYQLGSTLLTAPRPATEIAYALDVHLGKLARYLRMLGIDTYYMKTDKGDQYLSELGQKQNRIVLTRDKGLLMRSIIKFGYWIRSKNSRTQLREVLHRYPLTSTANIFTRCLECNALLKSVNKEEVRYLLPPSIESDYDEFKYCLNCQKVYWMGSHYDRMKKELFDIIDNINR